MANCLFVYGTLKRGFHNHNQLFGAEFLTEARTLPGYELHRVGGMPFLMDFGWQRIAGELWMVTREGHIGHLDLFEGVPLGLYERRPVTIEDWNGPIVEAYFQPMNRMMPDQIGVATMTDDGAVEWRG